MIESTKEAYRLAALAESNAAKAQHEAWHRVTRSKKHRDAPSDIQEAVAAKTAAALVEDAVELARRAESVAETRRARMVAKKAVAYCESMRSW